MLSYPTIDNILIHSLDSFYQVNVIDTLTELTELISVGNCDIPASAWE